MKSWYAFVALIYAVWIVLVGYFGFWADALAHWRMSVVMILGSVVAGSTPVGGGSVAFPFMVLVFGQPPSNARTFGLAIQAVGMTSAFIFILCRRVPIQDRILAWTTVGAAVGIPFGHFAIAPYAGTGLVKLLFSCLWMSFAILTLTVNRELSLLKNTRIIGGRRATYTGLLAGLAGGVAASMVGVGIELILYTILVLVYRCDLKSAVPTAVSGMAIGSIIGICLHAMLGDIGREVFFNWLAAVPIVVFGAPFGAWLVTILPRRGILSFVSLLCVIQFAWTLKEVAPSRAEWQFVAAAMTIATGALVVLYKWGKAGTPLSSELVDERSST